ncbi:MAG TPA: S4 domain-containing protein [Beijerinckiaceae bacterium]|nr:S4 domain-containing protein [Beijerinckiaceae bacterium]
MAGAEDLSRQRLDKWLWHVRLQPTRSKAALFIRAGYARLNGQRVEDPAKSVRCGDVLTLALARETPVVRVEKILPRRLGAPLASAAYSRIDTGSGNRSAIEPLP